MSRLVTSFERRDDDVEEEEVEEGGKFWLNFDIEGEILALERRELEREKLKRITSRGIKVLFSGRRRKSWIWDIHLFLLLCFFFYIRTCRVSTTCVQLLISLSFF